TSSPFGSRCGRRRARRREASLPESPIARPPWWLMRPTMSLLILPTSTISTISTVSSSVTRMPPTKRGSLPRRFISAPICGPPPWTITGLMPTRRRRITSRANGSLRSARSIAAPPYLMPVVLPRNSRAYGKVSSRISARRGSREAITGAPRPSGCGCAKPSLARLALRAAAARSHHWRASPFGLRLREAITGAPRLRLRLALPSEDVPREILVAGDVAQPDVNVPGVDGQLLTRQIRRVEGDLLEELFHDRVQAPGA